MTHYYSAHKAYEHDDVTRVEYRCEDDRPRMNRGTDDEYSYGYDTEVSKSIVKGELADRIRQALNPLNENDPVYIIEETGDASYSDWTQGQYCDFYLKCGSANMQFYNFNRMLEWLDKEAPVE